MKRSDPHWKDAVRMFDDTAIEGRVAPSCSECSNFSPGKGCNLDESSLDTEDRYRAPHEKGECPEITCSQNIGGICTHSWHPANTSLEELVVRSL